VAKKHKADAAAAVRRGAKNEKTKVYFPGLHGLRFFAAMMVVFSHVELMKDYHGYPNLYANNTAVYESGRMGVTLFFVLSGFLIPYLLLMEKKSSGEVAIINGLRATKSSLPRPTSA
jgi:peptidoglycan/LPS O-acetylase OafA/YrhL